MKRFAALCFLLVVNGLLASDLIPRSPGKWLVHLKVGSPISTSFWAELGETGALRLSRKESGDHDYKKIYEGQIGKDDATKIFNLASDTLSHFHFPEHEIDSNDGTNVEVSLIFHRRELTAAFIALRRPQDAAKPVAKILEILNSKLPKESQIQ